jgi:hypothetical protein
VARRGTGATWNEQRKTWTFPSGATLTFGHMQHEDTKLDYQGAAMQFVGFDELTQFSETQYSYLHSRTRRLESSRIPIRVFSASNPGNVGHGWVKKQFPIDGKPRGRTRFIPARLTDNPHLDQATYIESLSHLPDVVREQLLNGDWGIFEGMAYPEFDKAVHVVKPMQLPDSWDRWEAMDHGVTAPTAWGLFASDYDGNVILADLYYQPGLPEEHAPLIKDRRIQWWSARRTDGPWRTPPTATRCRSRVAADPERPRPAALAAGALPQPRRLARAGEQPAEDRVHRDPLPAEARPDETVPALASVRRHARPGRSRRPDCSSSRRAPR